MCRQSNPNIARIIIANAATLMLLIGLGIIIVSTISQTSRSFTYFETYSTAFRVLAIVSGSTIVFFELLSILSLCLRGFPKICFYSLMIIGHGLIIIFFILSLFTALILLGAVVDKAHFKDTICGWTASWQPRLCFSIINQKDLANAYLGNCQDCTDSIPSFSSILECPSKKYAYFEGSMCQHSPFFELYAQVEYKYKCSGLCNGDQINCYAFSNPTLKAKLANPNIPSCFESILEEIKPVSISLLVISSVIIFLSLIILICSCVICCSTEEFAERKEVVANQIGTNSMVSINLQNLSQNEIPQTIENSIHFNNSHPI